MRRNARLNSGQAFLTIVLPCNLSASGLPFSIGEGSNGAQKLVHTADSRGFDVIAHVVRVRPPLHIDGGVVVVVVLLGPSNCTAMQY